MTEKFILKQWSAPLFIGEKREEKKRKFQQQEQQQTLNDENCVNVRYIYLYTYEGGGVV